MTLTCGPPVEIGRPVEQLPGVDLLPDAPEQRDLDLSVPEHGTRLGSLEALGRTEKHVLSRQNRPLRPRRLLRPPRRTAGISFDAHPTPLVRVLGSQ